MLILMLGEEEGRDSDPGVWVLEEGNRMLVMMGGGWFVRFLLACRDRC